LSSILAIITNRQKNRFGIRRKGKEVVLFLQIKKCIFFGNSKNALKIRHQEEFCRRFSGKSLPKSLFFGVLNARKIGQERYKHLCAHIVFRKLLVS
jgi:hypothetical protein